MEEEKKKKLLQSSNFIVWSRATSSSFIKRVTFTIITTAFPHPFRAKKVLRKIDARSYKMKLRRGLLYKLFFEMQLGFSKLLNKGCRKKTSIRRKRLPPNNHWYMNHKSLKMKGTMNHHQVPKKMR